MVLVSNPLPGNFVTYVGADDFEIGYREARYLFEKLGGKAKIAAIEGTPAAPTIASVCADTSAHSANFPASRFGDGHRQLPQPDARRVMEKFLTEHTVNAVLSANDSRRSACWRR